MQIKKILFTIIILIYTTNIYATNLVEKAQKIAEQKKEINNQIEINAQQSMQTSNTNTTQEIKKTTSKNKYKSTMFTTKNISDIEKLLPFLKIKSSNTNQTSLNIETVEERNITLVSDDNINIYLNSIMYLSKKNWAVWINGRKITNLDNGVGDIVITYISPLRIKFYWKITPTKWEFVNASKNIPESKYKIEDNEVKLFLSLSPNQTYIPMNDTTIEGKLKLDIEENTNNQIDNKTKQKTETELESSDNLFF